MDAAQCPGVKHLSKPTLFSATYEFELGADKVVRRHGKSAEVIRYSEITELRFARQFRLLDGESGQCSIRSKRTCWIVCSGRQGWLLRHEDPDSYQHFLQALADRVQAANPSAKFESGPGRASRVAWLCTFALGVALILAILTHVFIAGFGVDDALGLLATTGLSGTALAMTRRQWH